MNIIQHLDVALTVLGLGSGTLTFSNVVVFERANKAFWWFLTTILIFATEALVYTP